MGWFQCRIVGGESGKKSNRTIDPRAIANWLRAQ
jgi:hypothetical protein